MERAVVVMAAVVERAAGCRVRGTVDLENRVGRFELEGLGHVRVGPSIPSAEIKRVLTVGGTWHHDGILVHTK